MSDLEAFVVRVQMDPKLQERLRKVTEPEAFVPSIIEASAELGFEITPRDVEGELRVKRAPVDRAPADLKLRPWLQGWTPVWVHSTRPEPAVEWCHFGERRLIDPFFSQTTEQVASDPFNVLFRQSTSLDALVEQALEGPGLPPTGFIFHVSRCGSTLISQMLAASPRNRVVSEAAPLEGILRLPRFHETLSQERHITLIRAVVSTLGRASHGEERLFVKFEPWHCLDLRLLRLTFPDVPFLLVYRDPVQILESQTREPSGRMVPNPIDAVLGGLDPITAALMPIQQYRAHILSSWFRALIQASQEPLVRLLEYSELPDAIDGVLQDFWHLDITNEERQEMLARARSHSKNSSLAFAPALRDRADLDPAIREAAQSVFPSYRTLKDLDAGHNKRLGT